MSLLLPPSSVTEEEKDSSSEERLLPPSPLPPPTISERSMIRRLAIFGGTGGSWRGCGWQATDRGAGAGIRRRRNAHKLLWQRGVANPGF